jgi:hypothetical protein
MLRKKERYFLTMANQNKRWNLFARELEDILTARNLKLGLLDDRVDIHREKVRRLQQSLLTPKRFPVLNPEEIDLLVQAFHLSEEEWVRLRAAMLATAIERILMERIDRDNALLASEQIYTILRDGLQAQLGEESGMGLIRGGEGDSLEETEEDMALTEACSALDDANMALQLSYHVISHRERIQKTKEAQTHFTEALAELDRLDTAWKSLQNWKVLYDEVQSGLASATDRLEDLVEE